MFRKAIQLRSRLFPVATGQAAAAMHTGAEVHKDDENLHNLLQERKMRDQSDKNPVIEAHQAFGLSCFGVAIDQSMDDPEKASAFREELEAFRSAITHLLCGIYALLVVVLGLVFPITDALTRKSGEQSYYVEIFHLYIYLMAIAFLVYLHAYVLRHRREESRVRNIRLVSNNRLDADKTYSSMHSMRDVAAGEDLPKEGDGHQSRSRTPSDLELDVYQPSALVSYEAEGVNFYLRIGSIAFSAGSMIHDGFKIASVFESGATIHCYGALYILVAVTHLLFTFFQTFFLFKSHKVVINMHKALARFGLVHIAATNLCVWLLCTIHETDEDWRYNEAMQKYNVVESASTPKPSAGVGAKNSVDTPKEDVVCYVTTTLARNTAPFLFPCTAQYSLIALAMIYKIYCSVGKLHRQRHQTETDPRSLSNPTECHKANKGLFLGLFIAILTLISMSCFFVFDKKLNNAKSAAFIFYITETTLLSLCAGVVVVAFFKLQQLRFLGLEEASFESLLLVISLSGLCMYNIFLVVSSIATVSQFGVLSGLSLISSLLAFVEAALQSVFILDGMRRCAANDGQVMMKPGRALVTFLLLVNLCLWVLNAFEARKADSMPAHTQYYGFLAWSIISHICIPMIIFFRFHSAVCLSDIWTNAYVIKRKEL